MIVIVAFGALSIGTALGWALHGVVMREVALMKERERYDLYELDDENWDDWSGDDPKSFGSVPDGSANNLTDH